MTSFRYKALTPKGTIVKGEIEASSEALVIQSLRQQGYFPISASDANQLHWRQILSRDAFPKRKPSSRDLSIATQELATLLEAGLELDRALNLLAGLGETERLHSALTKVLARVRDGSTLSDALALDPIFPKFYVNMVRAGEMGGNLESTLRRLAEYLARAHAIRETIGSALVYPIMLLATAGLSIIVILVFVLPEFKPLFEDAGKQLPIATRIVMAMGDFIGMFWWLLLALVGGSIWWLRRELKDKAFRLRWDGMLLRLPLFGPLFTKMEIERFSRTLGTLLTNGVNLPTALGITRDTVSNSVISGAIAETAISLREGESLANRLARTKVFPAISLDLIRVGEETGQLDAMLLRQADLYEQSVKHTVERLLALLVPLLTIFLGLVVAGLIASMLMAILSVNDLALG